MRLTVEDDGRGMDDQTLQRIFDPFFTTKEIGRGTGLGLSVVHGIVEAHDGFINVQSRPEAGSTFQIYFPITTQSAAVPVEPPAAPSPGGGEAILLVDDEAVVLRVTRTMLEKLGYTVEAFTDPAAVLDVVVPRTAALPPRSSPILPCRRWMAWNWRGESGSVRPGFPIILYSGYGGRLTAEEAVKMGFVATAAQTFPDERARRGRRAGAPGQSCRQSS